MIAYIYGVIALLGAAATVIFTACPWPFAFLLAPGYLIGLFALHILFVFIVSRFVDKTKPVEHVGRFWHFMTVHTVDGVMKVARVHVHVSGEQLLPRDRRFMLVSNHLSRFDPMLCMVRFRKTPLAFVSKPENFDIPIAGEFVHMCRYLSIDRDNARNALTTLNTAAEYIKSGELSVGIYPEGTRSQTGELLEFKDGVFKIARDTHAPIVVMTLRGTDKIHKNFPWRPTRVDARIIRVIEPEEYAGMRIGAISAMVREIMVEDLEQ